MLSRKQLEYTLGKSGWILIAKNTYRPAKDSMIRVNFHKNYITFMPEKWPRISYRTLTPELWTELTGLKFHEEEK